MKKHSEIEKKLTEYIFGELSKEDAQLVGQHLAECPECSRELEELKSVVGALNNDIAGNDGSVQPLSDLQRATIFAAASEPVSNEQGPLETLDPKLTEKDPSQEEPIRDGFTLISWFRGNQRNILNVAAGLVLAFLIWIVALPQLLEQKELARQAPDHTESAPKSLKGKRGYESEISNYRVEESKKLNENEEVGWNYESELLNKKKAIKRVESAEKLFASKSKIDRNGRLPSMESILGQKEKAPEDQPRKLKMSKDSRRRRSESTTETHFAEFDEADGREFADRAMSFELQTQKPRFGNQEKNLEKLQGKMDQKAEAPPPGQKDRQFSLIDSSRENKAVKGLDYPSSQAEIGLREVPNEDAKYRREISQSKELALENEKFLESESVRKDTLFTLEDNLSGAAGNDPTTQKNLPSPSFDSSQEFAQADFYSFGGIAKTKKEVKQPNSKTKKPVVNNLISRSERDYRISGDIGPRESPSEGLSKSRQMAAGRILEIPSDLDGLSNLVKDSTISEDSNRPQLRRKSELVAQNIQEPKSSIHALEEWKAAESNKQDSPPKLGDRTDAPQPEVSEILFSKNSYDDDRKSQRERGQVSPLPVDDSVLETFDLTPEVYHELEKRRIKHNGDLGKSLVELGAELGANTEVYLDSGKKELILQNPTSGEKEDASKIIGGIQAQIDADNLRNVHYLPPLKDVNENSVSTFSIDVDTASYTAARRDILNGHRPKALSIRPEEFINYFDYKYKTPQHGTFSIITDYAPSPFQKGLQILRVAIQGKRPGSDTKRPSCLTFVLDTSGSMAEPNRLPLVQRQIPKLLDQMGPHDLITVITTDVTSRLVLDQVPVVEKDSIIQTVNRIQAKGGTNLEAGLVSAYNHAERYYQGGAYNRVVLFSDGVANLGEVNAETIRKRVEKARKLGITFTAVGVGRGLYNDKFLEELADKGDGNYLFVDSDMEAERVFVDNFSANFNVIAKDVKIQVEFNPKRVKSYRLIGYDNRRLKKEDFRDDTVDAGEVGAGQSVTALYEVELVDENSDTICDIRVRYKDPNTNEIREYNRICDSSNGHPSFTESAWAFRLASVAAEFAEYLKYGQTAKGISLEDLQRELRPISLEMKTDPTISELNHLIMQVK